MHFKTQYALDFSNEIIVDYFCGGGGAGTGLEMGLQRPVTVAKNHNPAAISMHQGNHPHALHLTTDVFKGDIHEETGGRPVGWFHASPDCTHHSCAAGGQPRKREIRNLSWVVLKWAGKKKPRLISIENVKQLLQWGRLIAKRCPKTGLVIKLDRTVAAPGERVPVQEQFLVPDPKCAGKTWRRFVSILTSFGYVVEWRIINAADFGAPTARSRLFMLARCDGHPIVWPEATHAKVPNKKLGQKPWRTAAECIDWSIEVPSIFARKRPLADATMRRIAKGLQRYVLDSADPFIVEIANWSRDGMQSINSPLRTITGSPKGGAFAIAAPTLVKFRYDSDGGRLDQPLPTITAGGNSKRPAGAAHAMGIATAWLAQMNNHRGKIPSTGRSLDLPMSTITITGSQQQLVTAQLHNLVADSDESEVLGQSGLSSEHEAGALRVAAFLIQYYSEGQQWGDLRNPLATITTKERIALVTVTIAGTPYVIVDIGLRMLHASELYKAQGFPDSYQIEYGHDGRKFTKSQQVHMCGNSVSPPPLAAIARANDPWKTSKVSIAA